MRLTPLAVFRCGVLEQRAEWLIASEPLERESSFSERVLGFIFSRETMNATTPQAD
jgi:hypothetical protein